MEKPLPFFRTNHLYGYYGLKLFILFMFDEDGRLGWVVIKGLTLYGGHQSSTKHMPGNLPAMLRIIICLSD